MYLALSFEDFLTDGHLSFKGDERVKIEVYEEDRKSGGFVRLTFDSDDKVYEYQIDGFSLSPAGAMREIFFAGVQMGILRGKDLKLKELRGLFKEVGINI